MGVYSNSRFAYNEGYTSVVEDVEPDTSYFGVDGANRILYEAALNDMALFDAVIANDIQQAYTESAINEGADLNDQLVSLQEAAAGGVFSRLKEFIKKVWEKITGLIMSFVRKVEGAVTSDNKKLVDKFKKSITTNSTKLKKMKFNWSDQKANAKDFTFKNGITKSDFTNKCTDKVDKIFGSGNDLKNMVVGTDYTDSKMYMHYTDLEKELDDDDWENKALSDYVPNTTTEDFVKDAHEYFFEDDEEKDGEFSKYQTDIMSSLMNSKDLIKGFKKNQTEVDTYFKKAIAGASKFTESVSKYINANKDTVNPTTVLRKAKSASDSTPGDMAVSTAKAGEGIKIPIPTQGTVKVNLFSELTKAGNTVQRYYSCMQTLSTKLLNAQMAAVTFHIKQCRRVWIQAASFAERPVKEDALLFDAIGEAADFDTDQLIGY